MYVRRDLEERFNKVAEIYNIVAVVGARQSGKTTLLKKKLETVNGNYVTLDDPDARELFNTDIKKFEKQYIQQGKTTGIDEAQYGTDVGIKLKYLADKDNKIWVTSSSETLLSKDVLSHLVGRVTILRLYPFSLKEFQKAKKIKTLTPKIKERTIWEHANYGGYPKAVLTDDNESKKIILKDLIDTMLLKDVSQTFNIEDLNTLEKLTRYLAANTGNLTNYENITTTLGLSYTTLKKYLNAMEKSYIITIIKPYHTNKLKELSKTPKIYYIDTGLKNTLLKTHNIEVEGRNFENYVLTELIKQDYMVKHWRTKGKTEIDYIIEEENTVTPVEVKTRAGKTGRNMKTFIKAYKPAKAYLVYYKGEEKIETFGGCKITHTDVPGLLEKLKT